MRTFEKIELPERDSKYGMMYGKQSADGWQLLVDVVMYGYRIKVRRADDLYGFSGDYCGGKPTEKVKALYSLLEMYFSQDRPMPELLREIPVMETRPFYNDPKWTRHMVKQVEDIGFIENDISTEGLESGRTQVYKRLGYENINSL